MAAKFLDSLMSILQKHQVSLNGLAGKHTTAPIAPIAGEPNTEVTESDLEIPKPANDEISNFDEIWQSLNGGADIDTLNWNSLFLDLESHLI